MKTYLLRLSGREEGPFTEAQISQMFADGRVDRNTPCRPVNGTDWKTIDDYLPMLKYGTQLPPPSSSAVRSEEPLPYGGKQLSYGSYAPSLQKVSVVDIDLPFASILRLLFKWMAAGLLVACCFLPAVIFVIFIVMAIFGTLLGGLVGGLHHP